MRVPPTGPKHLDALAKQCGVTTVSYETPIPYWAACHYCGGTPESRDHIVANVAGGVDAWWNLVPSCSPCNEGKADRQSCSCLFCLRAMALWSLGYRRLGMTRADKKRRRKERARALSALEANLPSS
ncbi:HNH endonuclease [Microbacterium oxydans]|uniref:HNH endonuclease n=1 Tax=Microbacterium oxydans TaxID=82380 RepID=UPI0037CC2FD0